MKTYLVYITLLIAILFSAGCSAAETRSQSPRSPYVTVTPSGAAANRNTGNAEQLTLIDVSYVTTPPVDYAATSIAGTTATVEKAIARNTLYPTATATPKASSTGAPSSPSTPAPTSNPTDIPPATDTPAPSLPGDAALIKAQDVQFNGCSAQSSLITLSNASQIQGVDFKLKFNPAIVQVVDANPDQEGVQIKLGKSFAAHQNFVAVNRVDQNAGLIEFAAVMIGEYAINGAGEIAQIEWTPKQSGTSDLTFQSVTLALSDGKNQPAHPQNALAQVPHSCP